MFRPNSWLTLPRRHLLATVTTSLIAFDLLPDAHQYRGIRQRQTEVGEWLRSVRIPELIDESSQTAYRRLPRVDSFLWDSLAQVAGFGYQQAAAIAAAVSLQEPERHHVATLGALQNVITSLTDYLLDECGFAEQVFAVLDQGALRNLFDAPFMNLDSFDLPPRSDDRLVVLLSLMGAWARGLRSHRSPNLASSDWGVLQSEVEGLYNLEKAHYVHRRLSTQTDICSTHTSSMRACLPVRIMLRVATLALGKGAVDPPEVRSQVDANGKCVAIIDEIVDLADDLTKGRRSGLVTYALRVSGNQGWDIRDIDVYDTIWEGVKRLNAEVQLTGPKRSVDQNAELGFENGGEATTNSLREFSEFCIALWAGWDLQPSKGGRRHTTPQNPPSESASTSLQNAAQYLLLQHRSDFHDAIHLFTLPAAGATQTLLQHPCWLFPRTHIIYALARLAQSGIVDVPSSLIATEAMTILRAKHSTMAGGWNYIREMSHLPPDCDDLAIVLRTLHCTGGEDLAVACDKPVRIALDAMHPSGAVPTWILASSQPHRHGSVAASKYLTEITQSGSDTQVEVMANLCASLEIGGPARYAHELQRASAFVESRQYADGSWPSHWYKGPYYSTYICSWFVSLVQPSSLCLSRAKQFLNCSRNADGGWGSDGSDSLSTAFALLALKNLGAEPAILNTGLMLLKDRQSPDGGWEAVEWIDFPTPYGIQRYQSRCITTAFAILSLLDGL